MHTNAVSNARRAVVVPIGHVVDRTLPCFAERKKRAMINIIAVVLEWTGAFLGIVGSALLALRNEHSGWGFVCFLASNVCWVAYGKLHGSSGLIAMNLAFTATSSFGVANYFLK
jgi:hypothetical protein